MLGPVLHCGEIEGEALRLVPSQERHLAAYVRWLNDQDVTRYLCLRFGMTEAMEEKWFEGGCSDRNRVHWAIELGDVHIGATGIEDIEWTVRTGMTGTMIGEKAYWGKGVASHVMQRRAAYAFQELNLTALYTEIFLGNDGSLRAAQKTGYREYGRKPFAKYVDGEYLEGWLGVLSRADWEARRER